MSNGLPSASRFEPFSILIVGFSGNVTSTRGELTTYVLSERGVSQKSPASAGSGLPGVTFVGVVGVVAVAGAPAAGGTMSRSADAAGVSAVRIGAIAARSLV